MYRKSTAAVYKIALSAVVIALYFVVVLLTAEFSFGVYQIRIATAFYALAMPFPFLVVPLAVANCLSNVLGGMAWDIAGGFLVGLLTAGTIALFGKIEWKYKAAFAVPAILLIPSLVVPLWLAPILSVPYWTLFVSLLIGQSVPSAVGAAIVVLILKRANVLNLKVFGIRVRESASKRLDNETPDNVGGNTAGETNRQNKGV